jgi:hypothetical protein
MLRSGVPFIASTGMGDRDDTLPKLGTGASLVLLPSFIANEVNDAIAQQKFVFFQVYLNTFPVSFRNIAA